MTINRTNLASGSTSTIVTVALYNAFIDKINALLTDAVDSSDGKVTASQLEIDSDATTSGDRTLIFRLTSTVTRSLKWLNSSGWFRFTDNGGSTLYPIEIATATTATHAATKAQVDTVQTNLNTTNSNLTTTNSNVSTLQTQVNNINLRPAILTKSANYTATLGDDRAFISCTGTFTLSLTAAATLGAGWSCSVSNDGTGTITIDPNSSELIDGKTTITVRPGESFQVVCDGSVFQSIGRTPFYESGQIGISSGFETSVSHGLGVTPKHVWCTFVCVSSEQGYSSGDEVSVESYIEGGSGVSRGFITGSNSSTIDIRMGSDAKPLLIFTAAGNRVSATNANWNLIVRATL